MFISIILLAFKIIANELLISYLLVPCVHRITIVTQDCSVVGDVSAANCTDDNGARSDGEVPDEVVIDVAKAHDVIGEEIVADGTALDGNVSDSVVFEHMDGQAVEC